MDLSERVIDFSNSLSEFTAESYPSWQTAEIFNALMNAAKEQLADDPIISAISPAGETLSGGSAVDAGTMRAAMSQISSALGTGPAIA